MRKGWRRKAKVLAVDGTMAFMALQMTFVLKDASGSTKTLASSNYVQAADVADIKPKQDVVRSDQTVTLVRSRDWGVEDAEILMRIAMAEAEGEGSEGMAYVMMVVLNRVWTKDFPGTIGDVVFQQGQFEPVQEGGRYWTAEPNEECRKAYSMVLHGWDQSEGALYFCKEGCSDWMSENTEYLYTVGNHAFYK